MKQKGLSIVGIGIHQSGQITAAAMSRVESADRVLADAVAATCLRALGVIVEVLDGGDGLARRRDRCRQMAQSILSEVRCGGHICAVFYGHPAVFNDVAHEAVRLVHAEGYQTWVLPGVSAEDCLIAELTGYYAQRGLSNPFKAGWQSFEATDFLIRRRVFDPHVTLILWQTALLGNLSTIPIADHTPNLRPLAEKLLRVFGPDHELHHYRAGYDRQEPSIDSFPLADLIRCSLSPVSTVVIPPLDAAPVDREMMARLGMKTPTDTDYQHVSSALGLPRRGP